MKTLLNETQFEGSTILAYYINDATYEYIDNIDEIEYDDFFTLYCLDQLSGVKISSSDLDEVFKYTEGNFVNEGWTDSKKVVEEKLENISVDRPIILDSYALNNKVRTAVLLGKYQGEGFEDVMVYTINLINLHDRLIHMSYYKEYEGEGSIQKAKAKNDYIVLQLLNFNK